MPVECERIQRVDNCYILDQFGEVLLRRVERREMLNTDVNIGPAYSNIQGGRVVGQLSAQVFDALRECNA